MIREMNINDRKNIDKMQFDLQKYFSEIDKTRDSLPYKSIKDARRYMQKMIDDANTMDGKIFVAEEKDQIIGFIQGVIIEHKKGADTFYDLTHNPSKEGWVGLLFVKPEYRGGGTGQQLLDEMKKYFISKNCTSIRLLVLSDNKHAVAVYEKNGFIRHDLEMILKV
ncbi:MAG: GNAT family N-acetyltransferase [Candidatus Nanosynbacter sp.]|nr:GNAT family N-acetyltransferase [Candidatus Nanosynbacter sp.]